MADFEVKIKTTADLKAAKDLEAALKQQIAAAKQLGADTSALQSQLRNVQASIKGTNVKDSFFGRLKGELGGLAKEIPGFERLSGIIGKLGSGPIAAASAAVAALTGAFKLATSAVREFAQAEEQVTKLDAALAQTGQLTDQYREKLQALAATLQATTGVADDQWLAVLAKLTQFGANSSNIDHYADAVKNLAGLVGGDLTTASNMIARAMQGNFDLFARYGIQVQDAGSHTEKMAKLMEDLALRGGGQLEARLRTLNGQFGQLKNAVSDFLEAIGRIISSSKVLQFVLSKLITAFEYYAELLGGIIPKVDGLNNASRKTTQTFEDNEQAAKRYADELQRIRDAAAQASQSLDKQLAAAQRLARLQDELTDAKLAAALARVDADERAGGITTEMAIGRRAALRAGAAQEKLDRDEKLKREEIARRKSKMDEGNAVVGEAEAAAAEAENMVQSKEKFDANKFAILQKLKKEIEQRQSQLDLFNYDPYRFTAPELGMNEGVRTFTGQMNRRYKLEDRVEEAKRRFSGTSAAFNDHDLFDPEQIRIAQERRRTALELMKLTHEEHNKHVEIIAALEEELAARRAINTERSAAESITAKSDITAAIQERQKREAEARRQAGEQAIQSVHRGAQVGPHQILQSAGNLNAQIQTGNAQIESLLQQLAVSMQQGNGAHAQYIPIFRQIFAEQERLRSMIANLRTR